MKLASSSVNIKAKNIAATAIKTNLVVERGNNKYKHKIIINALRAGEKRMLK